MSLPSVEKPATTTITSSRKNGSVSPSSPATAPRTIARRTSPRITSDPTWTIRAHRAERDMARSLTPAPPPARRATPRPWCRCPGIDEIETSPPKAARRSRMFCSPVPAAVAAASNPTPSSRTLNATPSSSRARSRRELARLERISRRSASPRGRRSRSRPRSRSAGGRHRPRRSRSARPPCDPASLGPGRSRSPPARRDRSRSRGRASVVSATSVCSLRSRSCSAAFSGSFEAVAPARRSFTARATRCCCAPSWMFRSSRRRSASCAWTIRIRDSRSSSALVDSSSTRARSSLVSARLRTTRAVCAARSVTSFSSAGRSG